MSAVLTTEDIQALIRSGKKELALREGDRLTDLAQETLRHAGIRTVMEAEARESAPAPVLQPQTGGVEIALREKELALRERELRLAEEKLRLAQDGVGRAAPVTAQHQPAYDLVVSGGTCVIPEMGCIRLNVCIKDGKIAALTTGDPKGAQHIDATGLHVLPGIIDPHTHLGLCVPFEEELISETRSAILGGITTIGTYFNQQESYLPLMDRIEKEVPALSRVDMIPHFCVREELHIAEMSRYSERGMNSFKVYMCGVPGLYPHQEDGFILRVMERMKTLPPQANPILSVHCENTSICDFATESMQDLRIETLEDWNKTHPNLAEGEAVIRAAYLCLKTGVRTYIVHSSTKEAMEALRRIKPPQLYVETTSPYLSLDTDSDIGAYGKMLPPVREPESRAALWDGIRNGIIDTIGTDNTVMTAAEKKVNEGMRGASAGYPTLGTHLASVLSEGVFRQEIPLEKLVQLMTMQPAKIFGVYPRKGTLMPGSDADIVLVDLNDSRRVTPETLLSRSDFSLFQGKTLRAWPCATIKDGTIVAWKGRLVEDDRRGKVLRH